MPLIQDSEQKQRCRPTPVFNENLSYSEREGGKGKKGGKKRKKKVLSLLMYGCMELTAEELSNLPEVSHEPSGRLNCDPLRPKAKSST